VRYGLALFGERFVEIAGSPANRALTPMGPFIFITSHYRVVDVAERFGSRPSNPQQRLLRLALLRTNINRQLRIDDNNNDGDDDDHPKRNENASTDPRTSDSDCTH
jgi:hypothetical protein